MRVLKFAMMLGVFTLPVPAQDADDDLAQHAAALTGKNAAKRNRAIRELIKAGEDALPYLKNILETKETPNTSPATVCVSLYPEATVHAESAVFAKYRPARPHFAFAKAMPSVPRLLRGRVYGLRPEHTPRVLATLVIGAMREDEAVTSKLLVPLLTDADHVVRYTASTALSRFRPANLPDPDALTKALGDPATAETAAHCLYLRKDRLTALDVLREIQPDKATLQQRNALALLPLLPQPERQTRRYAELLGHGDAAMRALAHGALLRLGRLPMRTLGRYLREPNGEQTCRVLAIFAQRSRWSAAHRESIEALAKQTDDAAVQRCAKEALRLHDGRTADATLARIRPVLKELMLACIDIKSPNGSPARRRGHKTVFDGNYDFHSCVIAHWSLLCMARLDGDAALEKQVLAGLTPDVLAKEVKQLLSLKHTWLVFPYDQGYMLMLLSEMAKREGQDRAKLDALRAQLEDNILTYLEKTDLPDGRQRSTNKKTYIGYYKSWLIGFMLTQLSRPVGAESNARLAKLREDKLEPHRARITKHTNSISYDFLWVPAILAMIDRTRPGETEFAPYDPGTMKPLPHVLPFRKVHEGGQELSRLWPLAFDAGRGDAKAKQLWVDRLREYVENEEIFAGSFMGITHWIPQFMWIGLYFHETAGMK